MTTPPEIKSFSQALPILERHSLTPIKASEPKLWQVGVQTLDKGGVIALARELAAQDALTPIEQQALDQYEQVIAGGLQTFIAVGEALAQIRESRLYRATYATFEDYCRDRWGIGASRARQLIGAAETYAAIESVTTVTVANEAQLRPIVGLPPEQQRQAWQQAEAATGGKVTAKAVQQAVEAIKPKPVPILRVSDPALFDRAEQTQSISPGYLDRGKIKRPFEYDGKLWINVGGMYDPYGDDICECVRVVLAGESYEPGEENPSLRKGAYTAIRASAGGKTYELTGQWLTIHKPLAVKQQSEQAAAVAFEEARHRFAALRWKLERHGVWYKLIDPDGSHYVTTPDLAPQLDRLRTLEEGAARQAADARIPTTAPITPESRDADGPWFVATKSAAHPTAHHWNVRPTKQGSYFSACGIEMPTMPTASPHAGLCSVCAKHADRREIAPYPAPAAAAHPCDRCGQPATDKRQIGGLLAWRCDDCVALAEQMEAIRPLCEQAEQLGATIDYTSQRADGRMKVMPPAGYQQRWLWCDAAELGTLCGDWGPHASPAPAGAVDWDMIARRGSALRATNNEVEAWEHWRSIGATLARGDTRTYAARLLGLLAPLMADRQSEDDGGLATAINDLHECEEGSEGLHWARVGWALLDIEPMESEALP